MWRLKEILFRLVCLCVCFVAVVNLSRAQQLPIRHYDVSDGLAHNTVTSIYQDQKGYIWLSTFEGLSRFDGYHFTTYGAGEGLPHVIANHVTEDRQGRLWVATNGGGVARLRDDAGLTSSSARAKFDSFPVGERAESNRVNQMLFDGQGDLWCLTDFGLYRAQATDRELKFEAVVAQAWQNSSAMLEDGQGRLWCGVGNELVEVNRHQVIRHGPVGGAGRHIIAGIIEDRQGRLLVASGLELFEFTRPMKAGQRGEWHRWPLKPKANQWINALLEGPTGVLWLGTNTGLVKYQDGQQTEYTTAQGLGTSRIRALAGDRDGNLWIGTEGGGACKLGGEVFVSFTPAEGLASPIVYGTFEDREGQIRVLLSGYAVGEITGGKVRPIRRLDYPPVSATSFLIERLIGRGIHNDWWWGQYNWTWTRISRPVLRLRSGREIALTEFGPFTAPQTLFHFYEDETGKLWFGKAEGDWKTLGGDGQLYTADPARPGPLAWSRLATDFAWVYSTGMLMTSDRAGGLWLGTQQMLGRLWQGKFIRLAPRDGLPETDPRCFFLDRRGWLWIGLRYQGVSMTKEPGAEHPQFVNYRAGQGLSNNAVWSIIEDDFGRLYFGTDKGLDQFDPRTNRWRHYTRKDGLAGDKVNHLYKDRHGQLWVSTHLGVSRFDPRAERTASGPVPIYISRVNVAGEDLPLPEAGAVLLPRLELPAARNNLAVEFVGLQFQGEDSLTYEYQLEGVDAGWSAPTKSRAVNYARLAPGRYRFLARAINQEGVPSANPAVFEFRILPPLYQRWWFLTLAALAVGLTAYGLHRYRVSRLLELERVRTRIATDLHDDIGASLSRVAILSEVVKQQVGGGAGQSLPILTEIADSARGLVETMREIVWAIDPRRDELSQVVSRVRQFASDVFEAKGVSWDFQVPPELEQIRLGPEQRRHLFLIFKEAINNTARYADCRHVSLSLTLTRHQLWGDIRDDGRGFAGPAPGPQMTGNGGDPASANGHGLENMQRRAAQIGGQVSIESSPGRGTTIKLMIPLKKR